MRWQKTKRSDPLLSPLQGSAIPLSLVSEGLPASRPESEVSHPHFNPDTYNLRHAMSPTGSDISMYRETGSAEFRPGTMSPGGSIRSGATAYSLGDGRDTDNDNSDTGSEMSRFSKLRKPKKRADSGVREQDKTTEGMRMTHQKIVERGRQQRVGSHEGTISPGGSICSGSTGRSLSRDVGSDTGSKLSRFSTINSTKILDSLHASPNKYRSVAGGES